MAFIEPVDVLTQKGRTVTIRTAVPEDAEKILVYTKQVLAEAPFLVTTLEEFHVTIEEEESFLTGILESSGRLALMAEYAGEVAGFLDFHSGTKSRTKHTGSFGMSTAEDYRGEGIGSAMTDALCRWAEAHPLIEKINLEVLAENRAARRLYEKMDFSEEGCRRRAVKINTQYHDMILMTRFTDAVSSRD
ncbi:MAG: N-acetyltransferase [Alkalicoccus sp.]|nr:MAG: N-acetyltransferase [Alkalicoccus sp.]